MSKPHPASCCPWGSRSTGHPPQHCLNLQGPFNRNRDCWLHPSLIPASSQLPKARMLTSCRRSLPKVGSRLIFGWQISPRIYHHQGFPSAFSPRITQGRRLKQPPDPLCPHTCLEGGVTAGLSPVTHPGVPPTQCMSPKLAQTRFFQTWGKGDADDVGGTLCKPQQHPGPFGNPTLSFILIIFALKKLTPGLSRAGSPCQPRGRAA